MVLGGCTFLAGATFNGGAANVAILILGPILLGFRVGFTNQIEWTDTSNIASVTNIVHNIDISSYVTMKATPIYLSEMAPPNGAAPSTQASNSS
ncbi:hypothetical protein L1049_001457 [Liquidambar formosana]|uniref:Uncharacterized protein n=1 Tax=Liquidambar formosana TaxID=63359 RepID=A0AAP0NEA6_LIQFO